jgi:mono/diheme cytochrome c family protein
MNHRLSIPARAALVATLAALVACGGDPPSRSTETAGASAPVDTAGRAAYLANCSACHQREGGGLKGAFPPLAGADWLREQPTERSIAVVLRGLSGPLTVNGVSYNSMMPPMAHLSDRDVAAILTYVYASWGNDGRVVTADMVATVRGGGSLQEDVPADADAAPGHATE